MRLDETLKKGKELSPPATLRRRVMEGIKEEPQESVRIAPSRSPWLYGLAAAAVLVIAVRVTMLPLPAKDLSEPMAVPTRVAMVTEPVVIDEEFSEFLEETFETLYGVDEERSVEGGGAEDDIDTFISDEIETIFWIDEGAENA